MIGGRLSSMPIILRSLIPSTMIYTSMCMYISGIHAAQFAGMPSKAITNFLKYKETKSKQSPASFLET